MEHILIKIRKYENIHIVFWLMKDICWMLELKTLGALMIAPALFLAVYLTIKTWHIREVYFNAAIFFWILANSYWMLMEFFNDNQYKDLAAIPFACGFVCIGLFYFWGIKKSLIRQTKSLL